jgi:hypothetical protein
MCSAKRLLFLLVIVATSLTVLSQSEISDEELLQQLDRVRFPDDVVTSIQVRITATSPDEVRVAEVIVYFGEIEGGSYARIGFLAPEELAGQTYLTTPEATFFISPDLDFPIKVQANVELFGDAAVAQTSGIRFADGYVIEERTTVLAEEGTPRYELTLVAEDPTIAFQTVQLVVDAETLRPLSGTLLGLSDFPFYDVFFEQYATRGEEDLYVSTQRIISLLLQGRETVTETVEISSEPLPEDWFDPDALGSASD